MGPDGRVWVSAGQTLVAYDERGALQEEISLTGSVDSDVVALAFSPSGQLHFTDDWNAVYRLEGDRAVRVIEDVPYLEGLAFDEAGNLYVANGFEGEVRLYDASYRLVGDVFARSNISGPNNLVFLRDQAGAMTPRLLVANWAFEIEPPYAGGIVELNPAGLSTAGFRIGVDFLRFATATLPRATMGAPYAHRIEVEDPTGAEILSVVDGILPGGLSLSPAGDLSGVPEAEGTFRFTVRAERSSRFGEADMTLQVGRPTIAAPTAADGLLGVAGALTPDEERFLDLLGNGNARFDVGDYFLFLRDVGIVTSRISEDTPNARNHR